MTRLILSAAAFLAACGAQQQQRVSSSRFDFAEFRHRDVIGPAEHVPLIDQEDDQVGVVEIASSGAFRAQLGRARDVPVVHVRVTVRNQEAWPIRVPLDQLAMEGTWPAPIKPAAVYADGRDLNETSVEVPPNEEREIDVVFVLPSDGDIDGMPGFFVAWGVDLPGEIVRERTGFRPAGGARTSVARAFRPTNTL